MLSEVWHLKCVVRKAVRSCPTLRVRPSLPAPQPLACLPGAGAPVPPPRRAARGQDWAARLLPQQAPAGAGLKAAPGCAKASLPRATQPGSPTSSSAQIYIPRIRFHRTAFRQFQDPVSVSMVRAKEGSVSPLCSSDRASRPVIPLCFPIQYLFTFWMPSAAPVNLANRSLEEVDRQGEHKVDITCVQTLNVCWALMSVRLSGRPLAFTFLELAVNLKDLNVVRLAKSLPTFPPTCKALVCKLIICV